MYFSSSNHNNRGLFGLLLPILTTIFIVLQDSRHVIFSQAFTIAQGTLVTSKVIYPVFKNKPIQTMLGSTMKSSDDALGGYPVDPQPLNFREAEVLGLRLMQEGQHEEALKVFQKGLNLPGSRTDIIRTKTLSGPSPVGGSTGGTEGRVVQTLDEFELQAAHYNIACAYACLNKISEACQSLEQAFKYGFDNYATVRADPDLGSVHGTPEFDNLMQKYDPKKGGFFGGFFK